MNEQNEMSRRRAIGGIGVGLAGLAATRGFAAGPSPSPTAAAAAPEKLQDPATKYPKPPFKSQQQPWPGLASKMEPKPDHGEKSYKGSGRLAGRKALITGGDSGMERAAAIAFAREGADVAINYFPTEEFGGKTVFGRPGQPAELASIYVQLAASDGSFATGQVYGSSGGGGQP
jgi:hypothetical protein